MSAWLIPTAIALGFLALFFGLFRDRILPAREVEVAVVLATSDSAARAESAPAADGPMIFQASGWVEPDPLPIMATALVSGVIAQVHVLEGADVEKDAILATLIDEDHQLALEGARQAHQLRISERAAHLASIESARRGLEGARARAEASAAELREAEDRLRRYDDLPPGSLAKTEIIATRGRFERIAAEQVAATAAVAEAEAMVTQFELQTAVRENAVAAARVEVEKAELALSRTRIKAPVAGRVLRLLASPGQKKMLAMDDPDSATVAILYEPGRLQARIDVPLADAAGLQVGQRARIRSGLLPDHVFHGVVTRINGEADVQRNTLQAKVRIEDPVDQLRPEMLCRAEFLAPAAGTESGPSSAGALTTWVPQSALAGDAVWICDPEAKRVTRRAVRQAGEIRDGFLHVEEGLRPGEWVVLSPQGLRDGQRVKPKLKQP